jgi:hypothetical protein
MSSDEPTVHLVCGKIAAGKSTLVTELGRLPTSVVVREDYGSPASIPVSKIA